MTKSNLPSLSDLARDPDVAKGVELDAIEALLAQCAEQAATASAAKKTLITEVEGRYDFSGAYLREEKDTGTVHIQADGYDLAGDRPKKVKWDQAELKAIAARIEAAGDDPTEYLDITYTMQERRYTALPASMAKVFAPARTVEPGALTIKMVRIGQ